MTDVPEDFFGDTAIKTDITSAIINLTYAAGTEGRLDLIRPEHYARRKWQRKQPDYTFISLQTRLKSYPSQEARFAACGTTRRWTTVRRLRHAPFTTRTAGPLPDRAALL